MEITFEVELDNELVQTAQLYTGITDLSQLLTVALKALVQRKEGRRSGGNLRLDRDK